MRTLRAAAVAAVAALLAGCAGIPTSGPIQQGAVIAPAADDQFIRVIARPPLPDMTPEEVVRGFQEATASSDTGYVVARQYLTSEAALSWDPGAGISVTTNAGLAYATKDDLVTATGSLSGSIDASGQYTVAAPATPLRAAYTLERVGSQWRIARPPRGLVLSPGDIERGYRSFNLYFFTRDFARLVPAPVTLPVSTAGVATQLVRGLLAGATSWIAPAVGTAFPEGTRLALDSVPVVEGVADVALTNEVLAADDATRQALSAQLVWTLRQLPDVSSVRMTVGGQPLVVPGAGAVQPIDSWSTYDPDVLPDGAVAHAVDARGLITVDNEGKVGRTGRTRPAVVLPAVDLDSTLLAGLSADRKALYVGRAADGVALTRRYAGVELSRPSWDRRGDVWVVDRGVGLRVVRGSRVLVVPVNGLPDGVRDADLVSVAVSRDGARVALLVRRGNWVEPLLARVESTADAVRVSGPQRIESVITEAVDLAWQDAGTLLVLGRSGASSLEVVGLGVGSTRVRRSGAPEGAVTLAAGPGRATLVGTTTVLYRNGGSTWTSLGAAVDPAYPG